MAYYLRSKVAERQKDDSSRAYTRLEDQCHSESSADPPAFLTTTTTNKRYGPRLDLTIEGQETRLFSAGQQVNGCIYVDTTGIPETNAIQIICTQVYIYGVAQICGDEPGQPLKCGLFDYQKDVKVLSSAIKIVRRPTPKISDPSSSKRPPPAQSAFHRSIIAGSVVDSSTYNQQATKKQQNRSSWYENASKYFAIDDLNSHCGSVDSKDVAKLQRDRLLQRKVHRIVSNDLEHGLERIKSSEREPLKVQDDAKYTLDVDTLHRVRFSLTISDKRSLPGSFEHPHFQVKYRTVAVMIYATESDPDRYILAYVSVPLTFEPSPIVERTAGDTEEQPPVCAWINNRRLDRLLLSAQKRQVTLRRRDQQQNNKEQQQQQEKFQTWISRLVAYYCSRSRRLSCIPHVSCSLQLQQRIVEPGGFVPLMIRLEQHGMPVTQIIIHVKLLRQVIISYNVGELVESKEISVSSSAVDLTNIDGYAGDSNSDTSTAPADSALDMDFSDDQKAKSKNRHFRSLPGKVTVDLSQVLQVPLDCSYTITQEMTRDTFEVAFELQIKVQVGVDATYASNPSRVIASEESAVLYATVQDKVLHDHESANFHYLKPATLPLTIGKKFKPYLVETNYQ